VKALRNLLLFAASFALVCVGIGQLLPPVQVPIVTPKLEWLAEHGDDYDVLLLGTSRTFRQIIPEMLDAELAAAGYPVRSFNLGIDGMRPPEDTYVLQKALAKRTKPLRFVLVECNAIRLVQRDEDRDTLRAVYWHDWARTVTLFRRAFLADPKKRRLSDRLRKFAEAWPDFSDHAAYWMWNNSNLGRGHELLTEWLSPEPPKPLSKADIGKAKDGFVPASVPDEMNPAQRAKYDRGLQSLIERSAKGSVLDEGDLVSQDELRAKQRLIERAGSKMILIIPPFIGERFFHPKPGSGLPSAIDFSSPHKYPELYLPEHRADAGHTNPAGSKIYTRLLARELLPLLKPTASSP
jgi:hypothetical protein